MQAGAKIKMDSKSLWLVTNVKWDLQNLGLKSNSSWQTSYFVWEYLWLKIRLCLHLGIKYIHEDEGEHVVLLVDLGKHVTQNLYAEVAWNIC